ncbi:Crp/Fnr family transcriptional regulator [Winogradskyella endarachnes]|uniref:Cyclic nucleotide-binding domain-containing protein n=1 Tax=Winogradskyella endarachnes TaxID=2681965 RepID=A0A6L6U8K8_9FLAO|nr:Crp/Fnr family transcriptional regulator [Winogradskyella endarachnes]MUU78680.1 cyclic nucleotide-binding domain-containing protein [Winogradskyella endarachnes]
MNNQVKKIIDNIFQISQNSFRKISSLLNYETFNKGDIFIQKDMHNEKEYFVLNGVCKSYLTSPDGKEINISFFTNNSIISPHSIRTSNNISNLNFKALTTIEMASMNAEVFKELMIENVEIRYFGNTVLQKELILKVEKEIGLASLTAKERLVAFRKKYSLLENQISHSDIASYLGITNVSLSRLRKDIFH